MGCGCPKGSDINCPPHDTPEQEIVLPVCLPKTTRKQLCMKQHSIAVAWWATVEVLFGKIDHKTKQLKELNRLDWARQEGIMAEALCTYAPNAANITRYLH